MFQQQITPKSWFFFMYNVVKSEVLAQITRLMNILKLFHLNASQRFAMTEEEENWRIKHK